MLEQYSKELQRRVIKKFDRRRVRTDRMKINEFWAIDLVDMQNLRDENKYLYLLTVVDLFSRYAFVVGLVDKKAETVLKAFKSIGHVPENIWADEGSEFYNKQFKEFCRRNKINLYSTHSGLKSVFVERFNQTLKHMMYKKFEENRNRKYVEMLDDLVKEYNFKKHSGTGFKPIQLFNGRGKYEIVVKRKPEKYFKVGDYVRIAIDKRRFEKGFTKRWTKEVFIIDSISNVYPTLYYLKDQKGEELKGGFYYNELQKTDLKDFALIEKVLKKKGDKVFVKWDGYDDKFNQWISKTEVRKYGSSA